MADSSLLSLLDSSQDLSGIYQLFFSYLQPILKKQSRKRDQITLFSPFIDKSLSLLLKRLTQTPKLDTSYVSKLFDTYHLCLNCLDAERHSVEFQRLMLCYGNWGRYESEGSSVLGFIGNKNLNWRDVPELREPNHDYRKDTALLILEVIVMLVERVANGRSKDYQDYHRVLSMVNQIQPWLRYRVT